MSKEVTKTVTPKPRPKPPNAGKGRPKGSPNKVTREFRETIRRLLEENSDNVGTWLKDVAEGSPSDNIKPDPAKALDLMAKLAEFAAPKLGRVEHVGDGGGALVVNIKRLTDAGS